MKFLKKITFLTIFSVLCANFIFAQNTNQDILTSIEGVVIDSIAGDSIPFANITIVGTQQGVSTDENGRFKMSFRTANTQIKITYVGYKDKIVTVRQGERQTLLVKIVSSDLQLGEVIVRVEKYHNRNNPAVDLVHKVIDKKDDNQLEKYDFYQYKKYERLELGLANVSEKLKDRRITKNVNFFFEDTDTTSLKGKSILPAYLGENASEVFYRKSSNTQKETLLGNKHSDIGTLFDDKGMNQYLNHLYIQANVYDNEILLFKKPFLSPLSPIAAAFYRYYIIDTVVVEGKRCVNLAFFPRFKADLTFQGNLYITDDSLYALRKVEMSVPKSINVNFINNLKITQTFDPLPDGTWIKTHDEIELDFGIGDTKKGQGIYGKRNIYYKNIEVNKPKENSAYAGVGLVVPKGDNSANQSEEFWKNARVTQLNSSQLHVYSKTDSLMKVPDFKRFMSWKYFMATGYWQTKYAEFGPVASSFSYNDIEGGRIRFGGRTLPTLNNHLRLEGYGAYGTLDKKWKYKAAVTYQLNDEPFGNRPQSAFKAWSYFDSEVPGQNLENRATDNWLLSFNRGKLNQMYYKKAYGISYINEQLNGFSYNIGLQHRALTPTGSLSFLKTTADYDNPINVANIATNESFVKIRYAPKEEYFQGATYRTRIVNRYPVFEAKFTAGKSIDATGTSVAYQELNVSAFKRFFIAPIGHTDILLEGGRVFGKNVPFPMLHNFAANQSLFYEQFSYNQMNYLEFISDKYAAINVEHSFNGFFLNKIPLIKKLKFREFATFKAVYGGLDAANDPAQNSGLFAFPIDNTGKTLTYNFGKTPYMEASIGIGNIAKVIRIDLVRRLSYLDNTNVSKWRIGVNMNFGM